MPLPLSVGIPSSPIPITATFGEATPDQRLGCYELAATCFGRPLTTEQYIQREQLAETLCRTWGAGPRIWCLYNKDDPMQILSTCKTIVRNLVIRDESGIGRGRGYCIASVFSNAAYRSHGLASFLLKMVTAWMDGPGEGAASFLYSRHTSVCI